jgi:AcrR family transcriptional regulator
MGDRLSKSDWIEHGLRTLVNEGASGIKVGPMAEKLKVSRGSFYWHFHDVADFRAHLLQAWQARTTEQVIKELDAWHGGTGRLRHLLERGFAGDRLDQAIRSWATEDEDVATVVATNDARRVTYMADLLVAEGVASGHALGRATFLYWAYLGQAFVMNPRYAMLSQFDIQDISDLLIKGAA